MGAGLASPMLPEPMRVFRVHRETRDTVTLSIDASPRRFSFLPGQFNMLYVLAVGEVPISVSGDPARGSEIAHTVKAVGAVTEALCRLRKGTAVGVRGPYGKSWPLVDVTGEDLVLVAGGLGLAPLRPVVHHILRHRQDYGQVSLLVGARTPEDLLFRRDLVRWRKREDLRVLTIVDRAGPGWKGHVGVVPALLGEVPLDPRRTAAFVCGPDVMMRFTLRELARRGLPDERIHLSMERNMKCAEGFCGHCQYGPGFVCKDGPVFRFDQIRSLFWLREV
jgi:NAD(P)H-flavin reductase